MLNQLNQLLMFGVEGIHISKDVEKHLKKIRPGGVIIFPGKDCEPKKIKELTSRLRDLISEDLMIGVDQEGGRVLRLKAPFSQIPSMAEVAKKGVIAVREAAHTIGGELKACGINVDFAPVLDVN